MVTYMLAAMGVVCWTALAWAIWKWAPREKHWTVWCPVHKKEAKITVVQRAAAVVPSCAGITVFDATKCSLFKGCEVNCRKECLDRP